jgi:hypothetical protein
MTDARRGSSCGIEEPHLFTGDFRQWKPLNRIGGDDAILNSRADSLVNT